MCKGGSTRNKMPEKPLVGKDLREWRPVMDVSRGQRGTVISKEHTQIWSWGSDS